MRSELNREATVVGRGQRIEAMSGNSSALEKRKCHVIDCFSLPSASTSEVAPRDLLYSA